MPVTGTPVTPPPTSETETETVEVAPILDAPICDLPDVVNDACEETLCEQKPENLPTVPGTTAADSCVGGSCDWIFSSLRVTPTITGGSRIEWRLHPRFNDPGPYSYRLEVGRTGLPEADDWEIVGSPAEDAYYLIDDEGQRVYGKTNWTHYRVVVSTPQGTYPSPPIRADGDLSSRDRRTWRTILKTWQRLLELRIGQEGYLLKRRLFGELCPNEDVDFQTREILDPHCDVCYGTGFVGGYYEPYPCFYAALDTRASHNNRETRSRGTVDDALRVKATMLGVPQVFEGDVWVDKATDRRWYIHQIQNKIEVRGVAAVIDCELRLAPYTDVIYQFAIEDQLPV